MNPSTEQAAAVLAEKPRFVYAIATALGAGYLKPAPGTWGSLVGLAIAVFSHPYTWFLIVGRGYMLGIGKDTPLLSSSLGTLVLLVPSVAVWLALGVLGTRSSDAISRISGVKDPQYVVIDEVSGVHLSLILGLAPLASPSTFLHAPDAQMFALYTGMSLLNWKYLLSGFLLFRLFDIWKPWPVGWADRRVGGGFGIMLDDALAALYAGLALYLIGGVVGVRS